MNSLSLSVFGWCRRKLKKKNDPLNGSTNPEPLWTNKCAGTFLDYADTLVNVPAHYKMSWVPEIKLSQSQPWCVGTLLGVYPYLCKCIHTFVNISALWKRNLKPTPTRTTTRQHTPTRLNSTLNMNLLNLTPHNTTTLSTYVVNNFKLCI